MKLDDYRCDRCGQIKRDVSRPFGVGASAVDVYCDWCEVPWRMEWIPQIGRIDAGSGPSFQSFDCFDGRNQPVHVDSLSQLRRIERESEILHRNGEGQQMVWRDFSNDRSNFDQHTIMESPEVSASELKARVADMEARRKQLEIRRHGAVEPPYAIGPGLTESTLAVGAE